MLDPDQLAAVLELATGAVSLTVALLTARRQSPAAPPCSHCHPAPPRGRHRRRR